MPKENDKVMLDFEYSIGVLVPLWDNRGNPISSKKIMRIMEIFNEKFGGSSAFPVFGCYLMKETGEVKCEQNILIKAFVDTGKPKDAVTEKEIREHMEKTIRELLPVLRREVGIDLRQESFIIEADPEDFGLLVRGSSVPNTPVLPAFREKPKGPPDLKTILAKLRF